MRFRWLAVVVLLGGVAMHAPIQAQNQKRTAMLSVRVLVMRPCLVNTTTGTPGVTEVNCEVPGAPAPRMSTMPFQGTPAAIPDVQSQTIPPGALLPAIPSTAPPAAITTLSNDVVEPSPSTGTTPAAVTNSEAVVASDQPVVAAPVPILPGRRPGRQLERLRVLTVNF